MQRFTDGIGQGTKVILSSKAPGGELSVGDTGIVEAAWLKAIVLVRWDKDKKLRPIHRKRLSPL